MFENEGSAQAYPKCVARNIDPEIVAVEEVLIKPSLNGVASRKKSLHSLNHAPDLRGRREGRNMEGGRERERGGLSGA
jgi:hypothetical protein